MNRARVLCTCAAATLLVAAGSAVAGPRNVSRAGVSARQNQRVLQAGPALQRARPIRMAKFTKVNGKIELTTPWIDVGPDGMTDTDINPAFDCFEGDPNSLPGFNTPTGFNTCPPNSPTAPAGNRWYFGEAYVQPQCFSDMTLASGFNGADSTRVSWAWFQPFTPTNVFIAVSSYETFGTACAFPVDPGFIDGVIFEFLAIPPPLPPPAPQGSGFFADEDISVGPTPLAIGLPADGSGAYSVEFYSDAAATTLITAPGMQPFLWGTGEDEPTPDGRAGTQDVNEFQDDTAPFGPPGSFSAAECYNMTFPTICPPVLGAMMEFWAKGSSCYPDCNLDTVLSVADFGCFQTKFILLDPYADCDGSTTFTVADFGCFQTKFIVGCTP